ncbi:DUF4435 domain-containing protein [Mannheimia sp. HC-2023]|uniref:DUF4435 domain-containing protein n=1 Tax=Mannheimia indoligenes TaxID=3103145 RepID=UPI002FE5636E
MKDNLEYSLDAENTLSYFTETDYIVYVEDKDDEFFWKKILSIFATGKTFSFRYEENITGCKILDEKIDLIHSGALNDSIIVARDSDYLDYQNIKTHHKNILYTYGHSIETCLFSNIALYSIIENYSRGSVSIEHIQKWLNECHAKLQELIKLDIAVQMNQCGIQVLGNSCDRFLVGKNSYELDSEKISNFIDTIIDGNNDIKVSISYIGEIPFHFIKGHFLVSLISQFIRKNCLYKSLPLNNLMSTSFILLEQTLKQDHDRINYYSNLCSSL